MLTIAITLVLALVMLGPIVTFWREAFIETVAFAEALADTFAEALADTLAVALV